jgi:hypothetical protein
MGAHEQFRALQSICGAPLSRVSCPVGHDQTHVVYLGQPALDVLTATLESDLDFLTKYGHGAETSESDG